MGRKHGEKGQFVETVTLDDVRSIFDQVKGPVVLSADVTERMDCSAETARRKLETLYKRGELNRRKVGRRVIYWEAPTSDEPGGPSTGHDSETSSGENTDVTQDWSHGRNEQERTASQQVAQDAVKWLQDTDHDRVTKSDVPLDELSATDPLNRSTETLWTEVIRDAWAHLAETGHITKPTARSYRWAGETDTPTDK